MGDWSKSEAIRDMPVTSSVTSCVKDSETGELVVRGYAWSGGGRKILRVDLTSDQGKTWSLRTILPRTRPGILDTGAGHCGRAGWLLGPRSGARLWTVHTMFNLRLLPI